MRTARGVAVGVGLTLAMAACASQPTGSSVSASQLLAAGVHSLMTSQSFQVAGAFTVDGLDGSIQASTLHNGDVSGFLTLDGADSSFVSASGSTYFQTLAPFVTAGFPSLASLAATLKGQPWFQTAGSAPAAAVVAVLGANGLLSTFLSGRTHLSQAAAKDSQGRAAIRLSDAAGSVLVATSSPHHILEITSSPHYLVGRFSNVDVLFDGFDSPVTVAIPANYVTPDIAHMPPYFYIISADVHGCNSSGCAATAVVGSQAGSGMATVTVTITNSAGGRLASCTTTVLLATYSATPTAACHAHGSAWANWWNNVGGTYYIGATVLHPAYTS